LTERAQSILNLANVRYLLIHLWPDSYRGALEQLLKSGKWRLVQGGGVVAILENLEARSFVQVYGAAVGDGAIDDEQLLAILPQALEQGYALAEWPGYKGADRPLPQDAVFYRLADVDVSRLPRQSPPEARCELVERESTKVRITCHAQGPFLLMTSQTWYPHWQVTVNGTARPLLRLNGNFQGVYVASQEAEVIFRYRWPRYAVAAYGISALALLAVLLVLLRRGRPLGAD